MDEQIVNIVDLPETLKKQLGLSNWSQLSRMAGKADNYFRVGVKELSKRKAVQLRKINEGWLNPFGWHISLEDINRDSNFVPIHRFPYKPKLVDLSNYYLTFRGVKVITQNSDNCMSNKGVIRISELPALLESRLGLNTQFDLSKLLGFHTSYFSKIKRLLNDGRSVKCTTINYSWLNQLGWRLNEQDVNKREPLVRLEKICTKPQIDLSDIVLDVNNQLLYEDCNQLSDDQITDYIPIPDWHIQKYKGFHVGDIVKSTAKDGLGRLLRITKIDNDPVLPFRCEVPNSGIIYYKGINTIRKV